MRVLQLHNRYRQAGGEDTVVEAEAQLLRSKGHVVDSLIVRNPEEDPSGPLALVQGGLRAIWSEDSARQVRTAIGQLAPDVVHVHNTLSQLSPSVIWAANGVGVPVVQSLHNFRLVCANGLLFREGKACEACLDSTMLLGVARGCYRGSIPASAVVVASNYVHRALGTYRRKAARLIAPSEFSRRIFVRGGLPADRIAVKPHFVFPPAFPVGPRRKEVVFAGRISPEKGADVVLEAWRRGAPPEWKLVVLGDGEARAELQQSYPEPSIEWGGWSSSQVVRERLAQARYYIAGSKCYESAMNMSILEAFSCGLPSIVPAFGNLGEGIRPGHTGFHYQPGGVESLAAVFRTLAYVDPEQWSRMSDDVHEEYEIRYSPQVSYRTLIEIYESAIAEMRQREPQNA